MPPHDEATPERTPVVRRAVLGRAATALAGAAGLGAVAMAQPAAADPGGAVLQGAANDAGPTSTSLTSASPTGTLAVANTGTGGNPLRVVEQLGTPPATSQTGDLRTVVSTTGGAARLAFTHLTGTTASPARWGYVLTEGSVLQPIPVNPQRALDTRTEAGRSLVTDPAGKFEPSTGRLLANQSITLSLVDMVFACGGVFANATVTGPTGAGNLSVYSAEPRPGTSTLNFVTGQTVANFCFTGLAVVGQTDITVKIFTTTTTHVLLDVLGFSVGSPELINPGILPPDTPSGEPQPLDPARAPAWYRERNQQRGR